MSKENQHTLPLMCKKTASVTTLAHTYSKVTVSIPTATTNDSGYYRKTHSTT